jgi:hypothetical protein
VTIWSDSLDAIYASDIAVNGTLSPGTGGDDVTLRMIDKTVGLAVGDPDEPANQTILPAAFVRLSEMAERSVTRAQIESGTVTIAGRDWRVKSTQPRPSPDGEQLGELCMFLMGDNV